MPMSGPTFGWDRIDFVVVHWPGHNGVPAGGQAVADLLRRNHESSVANKGYSHYYNVMVDRMGETWEVRGDTFQNAANAPAAFNRVSFSIQVMANLDGETSPAQDAALADLIAQVRALRPSVTVLPHTDGVKHFASATRTVCCGPIAVRVRSGEFDPPTPEPEPEPVEPPPPPTFEEELMIPAVAKTTDGAWLAQFTFRGPVWKVGPTADHDVTAEEVIGRGGGHIYDVVSRRVLSTWSAIPAAVPTVDARTLLKAA